MKVFRISTVVGNVDVVDTPSNDGAEEMVRGEFPGVRFVSDPTRGLAYARNRGIAESRGRHVLHLDSDTVISYGDLLFRSYVLRDLVESQADFSVVIDSAAGFAIYFFIPGFSRTRDFIWKSNL